MAAAADDVAADESLTGSPTSDTMKPSMSRMGSSPVEVLCCRSLLLFVVDAAPDPLLDEVFSNEDEVVVEVEVELEMADEDEDETDCKLCIRDILRDSKLPPLPAAV